MFLLLTQPLCFQGGLCCRHPFHKTTLNAIAVFAFSTYKRSPGFLQNGHILFIPCEPTCSNDDQWPQSQ